MSDSAVPGSPGLGKVFSGGSGSKPAGAVTDDAPIDAKAYRRGDPAYFGILVKRFGPLIRTVVKEYSEDGDEREDMYQEVCIRLLRRAKDYRESGAFRGWVGTIARGVCRNWNTSQAARDSAIDRYAAELPPVEESDALLDDPSRSFSTVPFSSDWSAPWTNFPDVRPGLCVSSTSRGTARNGRRARWERRPTPSDRISGTPEHGSENSWRMPEMTCPDLSTLARAGAPHLDPAVAEHLKTCESCRLDWQIQQGTRYLLDPDIETGASADPDERIIARATAIMRQTEQPSGWGHLVGSGLLVALAVAAVVWWAPVGAGVTASFTQVVLFALAGVAAVALYLRRIDEAECYGGRDRRDEEDGVS